MRRRLIIAAALPAVLMGLGIGVAATALRQRFFWRDRDGFIRHAGSDRGVFTCFYFDRASRSGYIVLINRTRHGRHRHPHQSGLPDLGHRGNLM